MADGGTKTPTRFTVDLGDLVLPPVVTRQIESEIRAVVLRALAHLDTEASSRLDPALFGKFAGRTLGLWIDPEHPEEGSWEDTVPFSGGGGNLVPYVTHNRAMFRTTLATSKTGGAEAIVVSRAKGSLRLEQLDGQGQPLASFVLRPIRDREKKVSAVDITSGDSDADGASPSLSPHDRAALAAIVDELVQIKGDGEGSPGVIYFWRGFFEAVGAGIACGLAAVEGGLNPLADGDCIVAGGLMLGDDDDDD
jgi:hypothetical protein